MLEKGTKLEAQEGKSEKELKWEEISQRVEKTVDSKGYGMDENIKEVVVALKANDFGTTASCEGHLDWGVPWPWIDVESKVSEEFSADPRYHELNKKARALRKGTGSMEEEEQKELIGMVNEIIESNVEASKHLSQVLDEYRNARLKEKPKNSISLGIELLAWNRSRLQPEGMPKGKPKELQKMWTKEEKENNLKLYRDEMDKFTEFLKDKYFE